MARQAGAHRGGRRPYKLARGKDQPEVVNRGNLLCMYCSACGKSISDNLNYCSGCGNRIEKNPLMVGNRASGYFAYAAGFIGVGALFGAYGILKILLESRLDPPAIIIIFVAYLLTALLLFSILVGHV